MHRECLANFLLGRMKCSVALQYLPPDLDHFTALRFCYPQTILCSALSDMLHGQRVALHALVVLAAICQSNFWQRLYQKVTRCAISICT